MPMEEARNCQRVPAQLVTQPASVPLPMTSNANVFSTMPFPMTNGPVLLSMQGGNSMENSAIGQNFLVNSSSAMFVHRVPPPSSAMAEPNLDQQVSLEPSALSLRLSLSTGQKHSSTTFKVISSYQNGDSIVSVA